MKCNALWNEAILLYFGVIKRQKCKEEAVVGGDDGRFRLPSCTEAIRVALFVAEGVTSSLFLAFRFIICLNRQSNVSAGADVCREEDLVNVEREYGGTSPTSFLLQFVVSRVIDKNISTC